jgi:hypothetical protein
VNAEKPKPGAPANAGDSPESLEDSRSHTATGTGRVKFDDRGNAIWEWAITTGAYGQEVSTERMKKLQHPSLAIIDEGAQKDEAAPNYDPYDSTKRGKAPAPAPRKKVDLRRLGEFLKMKKQAEKNKAAGDEDDDK